MEPGILSHIQRNTKTKQCVLFLRGSQTYMEQFAKEAKDEYNMGTVHIHILRKSYKRMIDINLKN